MHYGTKIITYDDSNIVLRGCYYFKNIPVYTFLSVPSTTRTNLQVLTVHIKLVAMNGVVKSTAIAIMHRER